MSARMSLVVGKPRLELLRSDPTTPEVLRLPAQGPAGKQGPPGIGLPGLQGDPGPTGVRGAPGDTTVKVVAASGVAVVRTGATAELALATIPIPARYMGANGRLRITALWTVAGTLNTKTVRCRFGGVAGTKYHEQVLAAGQVGSLRAAIGIENRNAANSQIGGAADAAGYGVFTTAAVVTSAIDTDAASTDIVLSAQLANAGDSITLQAYVVELLMPPAQAQIGLYFGGDGIIIDPSTFEIKVNRANVAPINSPNFTGTPSAPTPATGDNTTQIATTSYVKSNIANLSTVYCPFDPAAGRAQLGIGAVGMLTTVAWGNLDSGLKAIASDVQAGADQKFITPKSAFDAQAFTALTDAATILLDLSTGLNFTVSIAGNRTLGFPTLPKVGQSGFIDVVETGAGGFTLDFAAGYTFDAGTKPVIDTVATRITSLFYFVRSLTEVRIGMAFKGVRATP